MRFLSLSLSRLTAVALVIALVLSVFFTQTAFAQELDLQVRTDLSPTVAAGEYVPGEVLFKYKNDSERFRTMAVANVPQAIAALQKNPNVEYAEPNFIASAYAVPNDPIYSPYQWHFDNPTYGGVHAESAWDVSTGAGTIVAIVDTGIAYEDYTGSGKGRWGGATYYQAPDLAGTCFVQGYDFVNNDSHANDDEGHGTHVAGTVAQATNNNIGVAGLAYDACLMPVKVLNNSGSGSYSDIVDGIYYAVDNGADVINMSLGGSTGSSALHDAIQYAYSNGVTVVAASGNDNAAVGYPAVYDEVIAVGATRYDEARAPYSNFGPELDVVAPGGDTSVDQNGDGYVDGVLQQTFGRNLNEFSYYFYQGTSMAAPHVAAAAAMLISNGNATTPDEVREALQSTADDLGASGFDEQFGHGLINLPAALAWSAGPVDNAPTVSVTAPTDGAVVAGSVLVTATAADDNGVTTVQFYVDDILLGVDTVAPYEMLWPSASSSDGTHSVKATAIDTVGQIANSVVSVTVDNVNEAPTADAGTDQSVEDVDGDGSESVTLDASASSDDRGIVNYSWSESGLVIASGETVNVDLSVGVHVIDLEVTDSNGATSTDSVIIEVTPQAPQPDIDLALSGYKDKGRIVVNLVWGGAVSTNVDIYRNGSFYVTEANDGNYEDRTGDRGGRTYTYQVCEEGSVIECSASEVITF